MSRSFRLASPWLGLAVLAALFALGGLACTCTGRQSAPTPTRAVSAATATPRATPRTPAAVAPTAKPTASPTTSPTARDTASPTATATQATLTLTDPNLEEVPGAFEGLAPGAKFELILTEKYVSQQAWSYLDDAEGLPLEVQDIQVGFDDDIVTIDALIPLGFLRVNVTGRVRWWAEDCQFQAEIIDLEIAGGAAPASLREQLEPLLRDGLKASTTVDACFTDVAIGDGTLTVKGYKK